MVISFPFDIFTWKHLIGGISNPESLDRYVLMICDLRSPSSVYCCNRREVVSLWPLRLCRWDPARPHQAPPAAHRSVLSLLLASLCRHEARCEISKRYRPLVCFLFILGFCMKISIGLTYKHRVCRSYIVSCYLLKRIYKWLPVNLSLQISSWASF